MDYLTHFYDKQINKYLIMGDLFEEKDLSNNVIPLPLDEMADLIYKAWQQ